MPLITRLPDSKLISFKIYVSNGVVHITNQLVPLYVIAKGYKELADYIFNIVKATLAKTYGEGALCYAFPCDTDYQRSVVREFNYVVKIGGVAKEVFTDS